MLSSFLPHFLQGGKKLQETNFPSYSCNITFSEPCYLLVA